MIHISFKHVNKIRMDHSFNYHQEEWSHFSVMYTQRNYKSHANSVVYLTHDITIHSTNNQVTKKEKQQ